MRLKKFMLFCLSMILLAACADRGPVAKVTIRVVDEDNKGVNGALVKVGFLSNLEKNKEWVVEGTANSEGKFTAEAKTNGLVGAVITKDGYYESTADIPFTKKEGSRWLPWNVEVIVVLRRIGDPVPMYARNAQIQIPQREKNFGFDLIRYDWVMPYGKGKNADFVFKITGSYTNEHDFTRTLTIATPNGCDGLQLVKEDTHYGSRLKLPRYAPETGYTKIVTKTITAVPSKPIETDSAEENNYVFRTRSQRDGSTCKAMYGKIIGDFDFSAGEGKKASIRFRYYLNPDYSTNLEFNRNKNLFEGMTDLEKAGLQ